MSVPLSAKQFGQADSPLPLERVPVKDIIPTQVYLDAAKVEKLRKVPGGPDPVVARRNGRLYMLDGHHRWAADDANGTTHINVRVSE